MRQQSFRPLLLAAFLVSTAAACGEESPVDPCPGGICPADVRGGIDGSVPPTDAPAGTDSGGRDTTGTDRTTPAGCVWDCTPWVASGGGDAATRTCVETAGCGTEVDKPSESTTLPALDREFYECQVEPIVTRGCAHMGCHGTENGRAYRVYARGRHRLASGTVVRGCSSGSREFPLDICEGGIECGCWSQPIVDEERQRSFDSARGFALSANGAPHPDMTDSELLGQPLIGGGYAHRGAHFWRTTDADYQTILRWLNGERLGRDCNSGN